VTAKVFALDTQPGIQRDGTVFDKNFYSSGRWVRFQRARPRKILGFREIVGDLAGPSRGIYVNPQNNFNYIFNGYADGLQVLPINNDGVGSGISDFTLSGFTPSSDNLWQFDSLFDSQGTGNETLLAHPGLNLSDINNSTNTPVLGGDITGTTASPIGVFTAIGGCVNTDTFLTLDASSILIGAGQLVTGASIPDGTTVVSVAGVVVNLSAAVTGTETSPTTFTFDNQISVSGGVVVLHPYVFVYGNNGLIKNCAAGNTNNWVSADANETNVASTKVVQGLPVRGGSNAPSGLFWTLDSLVRVSYTPTTITIGATPSTFFWRYDIISSQSSILSSQCVIEYDGIYYWIGVDRFMLYNGVVKEVPNNMNQNYFFDNLNYDERQKVYATKVPRFGEIWWFFPSGDATECNDCIIYNIRENCWYDAGTAVGARRSAGYFSQVFRFPVNADTEINDTGAVNLFTISNAGSAYTDGAYPLTELVGGTGTGAYADITVAGGVVTVVIIAIRGLGYTVGDTLTCPTLPAGGDFEITLTYVMSYVSLWQHEFGVNSVKGIAVVAIESFFETNDLGWLAGGPSQPSMMGENKWIRVERIEPDFVQVGEMECYVTGRPYAQADDETTGPYLFDPDTHKIDMKEQRREMRLKFVSNTLNGNYQVGRLLLNATFGDVRGY